MDVSLTCNCTASSTTTRKSISLSDISPLITCSRPQWGWDHANIDVRDTEFTRGKASRHLLFSVLGKAYLHSLSSGLSVLALRAIFSWRALPYSHFRYFPFEYALCWDACLLIYSGYLFRNFKCFFITASFLTPISDTRTVNNGHFATLKVSYSYSPLSYSNIHLYLHEKRQILVLEEFQRVNM